METQPRKRRRPALSCIECRRRKVKCDRTDPCTHCVVSKVECNYRIYNDGLHTQQHPQQNTSWASTPSESTNAPSPKVRPQQPNADGSDIGYGAIRRQVIATALGWNETPNHLPNDGLRPTPRNQDAESDFRGLIHLLKEFPAASTTYGPSETSRNISASQSGSQDSQIIMNKTRTLKWSHYVGAAEEFAIILACYAAAGGCDYGSLFQGADTRELVAQIGDLLKQCKETARSIKIGRPSRCLSSPKTGLLPPARELADTMVTHYFESFESTHRILHVPTFWADYQKYWSNPESASTTLRLKILLVIGIGSSLYEFGDTDGGFHNMVRQWVYTAQTWLSGPLEKDRLNISGLQIHCLTILAREILSIGGDLVWVSMGSLINSAMQIALHRDPKHLPPMSVLQTELRRRLWVTILEMVVQSSLDSALPPRLSFDDFDTEAPSNINDDEMDELTTAVQPRAKNTFTTTSMQLMLYSSLETRFRIVKLLNGLSSEISHSDVLSLSSELNKALCECNRFIVENERSGVTRFHRNLLDYLVRRFIIPLHCPFATRARANPLFHFSLKASLDAAMAIISPEPDASFSHLMAIGGGMFREGVRCASTVISLELITQVEAQDSDGTLQRNVYYREPLKRALRNIIALAAERIRQGETNIKLHMFLCMVLAQVEAIEAGVSCEPKVAQSAILSLEFCLDLLQTRLGNAPLSPRHDTNRALSSFGSDQGDFGLDLDLDFFFPDAGFT
ncbi:hypothetical protein CC78DRAFT_454231 [Lojkania enalia]|uniref:Zn(2)-C6 fungal-type domain-containing protein n=1 Tax=Lojkania enalia TaxID=147567 RepID=A0A9P4KIG1_9PLEO|nr:hypothetical protein CC78DRAFT_454231 [Didymosphaeria enalia]